MAELDVMGEKPREGAKHGGRHMKRARGGSTTNEPVKGKEAINQYNAKGSPTMSEATNRTPGFKRGGKLKDGGRPQLAEGGMAARRMDRLQRGGSARTPYSTGSQLSPPQMDRNSGHEDAKSA